MWGRIVRRWWTLHHRTQPLPAGRVELLRARRVAGDGTCGPSGCRGRGLREPAGERTCCGAAATSRPPPRPNARPLGPPSREGKTKPPAPTGGCPNAAGPPPSREGRFTHPRGRSPDFRIKAPPTLPRTEVPVASFGIAPRSQWRDRAGLTPASLFSSGGMPPPPKPPSGVFSCRRRILSHPRRARNQSGCRNDAASSALRFSTVETLVAALGIQPAEVTFSRL
jgi:hypothetical protein